MIVGEQQDFQDFNEETEKLADWKTIDVPVENNRMPLSFIDWIREHALHVGYDFSPETFVRVRYIDDGTAPPVYSHKSVSVDVEALLKKVRRKGVVLPDKKKREWE